MDLELTNIPKELLLIAGPLIGSFIGSGITLFVTYIQNKQQIKRLEMQFSHEQEIKRDERTQNLKRDIYFDALKVINEAINTLYNLAKIDIDNCIFSDSEIQTKTQKIQLIADKKILVAFDDLQASVLECFFKAIDKKLHLVMTESDMNAEKELLIFFETRQKQICDSMEECNKAHNHDSILWAQMGKDAENMHTKINDTLEKQSELNKKILSLRMELQKITTPYVEEFSKKLSKIIVLIRSEIDLKIDAETIEHLQNSNKESTQSAIRKLDEFIVSVEKMAENNFVPITTS